MTQAVIRHVRTLLVWVAAPWLCGCFVALALTLARALLAAHAPGGRSLDLPLTGTLWVATRPRVVALLVAAGAAGIALAFLISRRMAPSL